MILSSSLKINDKQKYTDTTVTNTNNSNNESINQNESNKENFENFMSSTPISSSSLEAQKLKSNILPSAIKPIQTLPSMLNMVRKNNLIEKLNKEAISTKTSIMPNNLDSQSTKIKNTQTSLIVCQNKNISNDIKSIESKSKALEVSVKHSDNKIDIPINIIEEKNDNCDIILIENDSVHSKPLTVNKVAFKQSSQINSNPIPPKLPNNMSYEDLQLLSQTLLTCISQTQNTNKAESNIDFLSRISVINNQNTIFYKFVKNKK
jgi:hypothetical protein